MHRPSLTVWSAGSCRHPCRTSHAKVLSNCSLCTFLLHEHDWLLLGESAGVIALKPTPGQVIPSLKTQNDPISLRAVATVLSADSKALCLLMTLALCHPTASPQATPASWPFQVPSSFVLTAPCPQEATALTFHLFQVLPQCPLPRKPH